MAEATKNSAIFDHGVYLHHIAQYLQPRESALLQTVNRQWCNIFKQYSRQVTHFGWRKSWRNRGLWNSYVSAHFDFAMEEDEMYKWMVTKVSHFMPPLFRSSFCKLMTPLEDGCQEVRQGSVLGRGDGVIRDTIDPSFNVESDVWVATRFDYVEGEFIISTTMPGVPHTNIEFYESIAGVLNTMLPELSEPLTRMKWDKGPLDIVVKSQVYELGPGETYTGEFHTDGLPMENLLITAIWYYDISSELRGGDLAVGGLLSLACGAQCFQEHTIPVEENDVLFFENQTWVHQVTGLTNTGTKQARRKILTFFIVDPTKKGTTSNEVSVNSDIMDLTRVRDQRDAFRKKRMTHEAETSQILQTPPKGMFMD